MRGVVWKRTAHLPSARVLVGDGHIGDGGEVVGDDQRDVEGGFDGGLVPAGEGAASVGGLELRRGQRARRAVVAAVLAAVEAAQLIVQRAGEAQAERRLAGREFAVEGHRQRFGLLVHDGDAHGLLAAGQDCDGGGDGEFGGVERDGGDRLGDGYPDGEFAVERVVLEVGREAQVVVDGQDGAVEAVGSGGSHSGDPPWERRLRAVAGVCSVDGTPGGTRTLAAGLRRPVLYPLSYGGARRSIAEEAVLKSQAFPLATGEKTGYNALDTLEGVAYDAACLRATHRHSVPSAYARVLLGK